MCCWKSIGTLLATLLGLTGVQDITSSKMCRVLIVDGPVNENEHIQTLTGLVN